MDIFGKLKIAFGHCGIKVHLQAPRTVSEMDANFAVDIVVTNEGEVPQTINSIKLGIYEDPTHNAAGSMIINNQNANNLPKEIISVQDSNLLIINIGETKTIHIAMPMNIGKSIASIMPDNAIVHAAANIFGAIENLSNMT